jgi:hypothetical protein
VAAVTAGSSVAGLRLVLVKTPQVPQGVGEEAAAGTHAHCLASAEHARYILGCLYVLFYQQAFALVEWWWCYKRCMHFGGGFLIKASLRKELYSLCCF